jgi:hypothetical protein
MLDVTRLTQDLIQEEAKNLVAHVHRDTLIDVFRKNFDLWTDELFPLLKIQKKGQYEYLVKILSDCGYEVSVEQVGLYLSKVRNERGTKKSYRKVKKEEVTDAR